MQDDTNVLVQEIEEELLTYIIYDIQQKKLSLGTAQLLAKDFLALLPVETKKDLLEKLKYLSGKYPEAQEVYVHHALSEEQKETQRKLDLMAQYIKAGDIENAIQVAKQQSGTSM